MAERREVHEPAPEPAGGFGNREGGQIEPVKSVEAPLPQAPAPDDE